MSNNENFYNKLNIWKMELLFIEENANMSDLLICEEKKWNKNIWHKFENMCFIFYDGTSR